jgi:DNA-directed RNA polymerase subunit alpha
MEGLTSAQINVLSEGKNSAVFVIEPLAPGFGPTMGNSLRRVLLSSLGGSAVTDVKIDGVTHEFTTIPHVKEDVLEIILNIKSLKVKNHTDEPQTLILNVKAAGDVTAKDINKNANVDILNPDQPIATLDKGGNLSIEMTVQNGRGFLPTEEREKSGTFGMVAVDAVFSPVESVHYHIENTRVGQMTNFDKLTLEITTNGIKSPREALDESISILVDQFSGLTESAAPEVKVISEQAAESETETELDSKTKVVDLDLSSRTINALTNSGIKTIGGLSRMSDLKLSEIKGLGNKGFEEVKALLNR